MHNDASAPATCAKCVLHGHVAHPFGTLKRCCGWVRFLVRGKDKVRGKTNLLTMSRSLRRVMTVLALEKFLEVMRQRGAGAFLQAWVGLFLAHTHRFERLAVDMASFVRHVIPPGRAAGC